MIELTRTNIRNAIILGMLFGVAVSASNHVIAEAIWHLKYPNGWYDRTAQKE
jgi:hypothetical protein